MHRVERIVTSLEVGFGGMLPPAFANLRGRAACEQPPTADFPYDDDQFDVVLLEGSLVGLPAIREAHRVLKPNGCLYFILSRKSGTQGGLSVERMYHSFLKHGFDIVSVDKPKWWTFGLGSRAVTVCVRKKSWKEHRSLANSSLPLEFRNR